MLMLLKAEGTIVGGGSMVTPEWGDSVGNICVKLMPLKAEGDSRYKVEAWLRVSGEVGNCVIFHF